MERFLNDSKLSVEYKVFYRESEFSYSFVYLDKLFLRLHGGFAESITFTQEVLLLLDSFVKLTMWSDFLVMKVHKALVGNSAYIAENRNYLYIKRTNIRYKVR